MHGKPRFAWRDKTERTVSEIVAEDGILSSRDILFIVEQLCILLGNRQPEDAEERWGCIHPDAIVVQRGGDVRMGNRDLPLSSMSAYLPPELGRTGLASPDTQVYALGTLMLYMATGQEGRVDADTALADHALAALIGRCTAFDPKDRFQDIGELLAAVRRERWVWKRAISASLAVVCVCLLAASFVFLWREGAAQGGVAGESDAFGSGYADGYRQGFSDAPGIGIAGASFDARNGSLAGNMAADEGPCAAYSGEGVSFVLDGSVFQMDPHTGAVKIVASDIGAYSLQYYDGWIYCCTEDDIVRIDPKTATAETVCDSRGGQLYIVDDAFYLYDSAGTGYLYRIDPGTWAMTQLNGAMEYRCLNIVDGKLYYVDPSRGGSICSSDLDGGNVSLISSGSYTGLCVYDGRIYAATEDELIRMDLNGGNPQVMSALPAYSPNVSDGGIFYISGSGRTLEWMSLDGRRRYTVVSTRTDSFNVAGAWILYRNEEDGGTLWRVRISGADNARVAR